MQFQYFDKKYRFIKMYYNRIIGRQSPSYEQALVWWNLPVLTKSSFFRNWRTQGELQSLASWTKSDWSGEIFELHMKSLSTGCARDPDLHRQKNFLSFFGLAKTIQL